MRHIVVSFPLLVQTSSSCAWEERGGRRREGAGQSRSGEVRVWQEERVSLHDLDLIGVDLGSCRRRELAIREALRREASNGQWLTHGDGWLGRGWTRLVLMRRGAAVPSIKTAKSKIWQLWVFPACPKILGCVADNFGTSGAGSATAWSSCSHNGAGSRPRPANGRTGKRHLLHCETDPGTAGR